MSTTRRGRPRGYDRAAALEQALVLFWDRGYEATSIAELTAAMGMGAPSLYAAFGSKRQLFDEVVRSYGRTYHAFMARALVEEPTLRRGVERLLREAASEYTRPDRPPGCLVISAAVNCSSPDVEQALRTLRASDVKAFEHLIKSATSAGELPSDTDPHSLALFTSVTLQGMAQQARDGATRTELEAVAALALTSWPWT
ncbi:TetR/AcrR family transcriptional regulator [Actinocorallia sp. API 0066]|uniref:TetR/AcrR family transcriptional regulator n=1 Tax=Actinocorallia sp. API 0066 TaxID=2896846 RepID=UPI001E62D498|nr:TetR/AcrR family transcriptional regulator [Actinocorallia sp. API 0066]MCD0449079.1 TetR/AcrR family transcriptional regulator [Actinocorallia sp. API 0066]